VCSMATGSICPLASAAAGACTPASTKQPVKDPSPLDHGPSRFKKGEKWVDLENQRSTTTQPQVPEEEYFYMPVQCQQCEDPPCVKVCPTQATWKEPDGIVVVDYNWCIGCRYCMAACPTAPGGSIGRAEAKGRDINPNTTTSQRPRYKGVVEKCTFCIQRTRKTPRYPACVEACPVGARKVREPAHPRSEIRYAIEHKRVFRLKEDLKRTRNSTISSLMAIGGEGRAM